MILSLPLLLGMGSRGGTPDGNSIELVIGKDKKVYGRTKFGTFQIRLNDLKKMIIEPALQKKS
jgi:hypothetical protein